MLSQGLFQYAESSAERTLNSFRGQLKFGYAGYCIRAHPKAEVQPKNGTVAGSWCLAPSDSLESRVDLFELHVALDGFLAVGRRKLGQRV